MAGELEQIISFVDRNQPIFSDYKTMRKLIATLNPLICLLTILLTTGIATGFELKTQYATIIYNNYEDLESFNTEIYLGKYNHLLKNDNIVTLEDELVFKIDLIVDKTKTTLNMFPDDVEFRIAVCGSNKELQEAYEIIYDKPTDFIAFYSPRINTVYFSVTNLEFQIIAHEFAHMIIEHYFQVSPPVKIHEILANYVEKNIIE